MSLEYPTFTGRSNAGRGKLFYGMTPERVARLAALREDQKVSVASHLDNLVEFTGIYLGHARQLAKCGQKDEARCWFRYFTASRVLDVLQDTGRDVSKLRESLNFLGLECHPLDVPSFTTDLESINFCLKEILSHVSKKHPKTKNVRRFDSGRPVGRLHGVCQHQ